MAARGVGESVGEGKGGWLITRPSLIWQTLGHLEKAVILELTLKHLKALTALTEQQHQKITALQNGE